MGLSGCPSRSLLSRPGFVLPLGLTVRRTLLSPQPLPPAAEPLQETHVWLGLPRGCFLPEPFPAFPRPPSAGASLGHRQKPKVGPLLPRALLTQTELSRPELPACKVGKGRAGVPGGNSQGSQKGRLHGGTLCRGGQAVLRALGLRREASLVRGPAEELGDKKHPACLPFTLWPCAGTSHWLDQPDPRAGGWAGVVSAEKDREDV